MTADKERTTDSSPPSKGTYILRIAFKIALWIFMFAIWGGVVFFGRNVYRRMAVDETSMTTLETPGPPLEGDGKGDQAGKAEQEANKKQGSITKTIFKLAPGKPVPLGKGKWAKCKNPQYEYWFKCPTNWELSKPTDYSANRTYFLQHPDLKSVAVMIIPFGIGEHGLELSQEIAGAEEFFLSQQCIHDSSKSVRINGLSGIRRSYSCKFSKMRGSKDWKAEAVFLPKGARCYIIFLRGLPGDIDEALPAYNRMVSSFISEKLPFPPGKNNPNPTGKNNPNPTEDKNPNPTEDKK